MMSNGTSRSCNLLGMIPECSWEKRIMGKMFRYFSSALRVGGQLLTARSKGSFSGKRRRRRRGRLFWVVSGDAQCDCVFMWENINELVPTGCWAVPIISCWENTCGKMEREKKREAERWQEIRFGLFVPNDSSKSEAVCRRGLFGNSSRRLAGFVTLMGGDNALTPTILPLTKVSLSNTEIPTSTALPTSELRAHCVGRKTKHWSTLLWGRSGGGSVSWNNNYCEGRGRAYLLLQ